MKDKASKEELIGKILELEAVKTELEGRKYTKDLFEFNRKVLQVEEGKGNLPLGTFHHELCEFVMDEKTNKKLVLVPRGHLKSTIVTIGYSLLRIAEDPGVRILIANATYDMACSFLTQIKKHLKENDVFKKYYGELAKNPDKWSENMITVGKKSFGKKEATVTAYGIGGKTSAGNVEVDTFKDDAFLDVLNGLKPFDAGIGLGVGAEFGKILVDLGWDMGLINISRINNADLKTQNAYLSVGYKF